MRQPFASQERMMANPDFPFSVDRRRFARNSEDPKNKSLVEALLTSLAKLEEELRKYLEQSKTSEPS
jgi:hypothetical protein